MKQTLLLLSVSLILVSILFSGCILRTENNLGSVGELYVLTAPKGVMAEKGFGWVKITWNSAPGAVSYNVYRSEATDPGTTTRLSAGTTALEFYDLIDGDNLLAVGTYLYFVQSVAPAVTANDDKNATLINSDYSKPASITLVTADIPTAGFQLLAPATFTAVDKGVWDRIFTWAEVAGATGYEIYEYDANEVAFDDTESYNDPSVLNNTSFIVGVGMQTTYIWKGGKQAGNWGYLIQATFGSNYVSDSDFTAATPILIVPALDAPAFVSATQGDYEDQVVITWSGVEGATSYSVWRYTATAGNLTEITGTPLSYADFSFSLTDATAAANMTYQYIVRAATTTGISLNSNSVTGWAGSTPFLDSPSNVNATDGDYADSILISWDGVDNATEYRIVRSELDNGNYTLIDPTTIDVLTEDEDSFYAFDTDATLVPGKRYWYQVYAVQLDTNDVVLLTSGMSNDDDGMASKTEEKVDYPRNLFVSAGEFNDRVELTWDMVGEETDTTISYKVYRTSSTTELTDLLNDPNPYNAFAFAEVVGAAVTNADVEASVVPFPNVKRVKFTDTVDDADTTDVLINTNTYYFYFVVTEKDDATDTLPIVRSLESSREFGWAKLIPDQGGELLRPIIVDVSKRSFTDRIKVEFEEVPNADHYIIYRAHIQLYSENCPSDNDKYYPQTDLTDFDSIAYDTEDEYYDSNLNFVEYDSNVLATEDNTYHDVNGNNLVQWFDIRDTSVTMDTEGKCTDAEVVCDGNNLPCDYDDIYVYEVAAVDADGNIGERSFTNNNGYESYGIISPRGWTQPADKCFDLYGDGDGINASDTAVTAPYDDPFTNGTEPNLLETTNVVLYWNNPASILQPTDTSADLWEKVPTHYNIYRSRLISGEWDSGMGAQADNEQDASLYQYDLIASNVAADTLDAANSYLLFKDDGVADATLQDPTVTFEYGLIYYYRVVGLVQDATNGDLSANFFQYIYAGGNAWNDDNFTGSYLAGMPLSVVTLNDDYNYDYNGDSNDDFDNNDDLQITWTDVANVKYPNNGWEIFICSAYNDSYNPSRCEDANGNLLNASAPDTAVPPSQAELFDDWNYTYDFDESDFEDGPKDDGNDSNDADWNNDFDGEWYERNFVWNNVDDDTYYVMVRAVGYNDQYSFSAIATIVMDNYAPADNGSDNTHNADSNPITFEFTEPMKRSSVVASGAGIVGAGTITYTWSNNDMTLTADPSASWAGSVVSIATTAQDKNGTALAAQIDCN